MHLRDSDVRSGKLVSSAICAAGGDTKERIEMERSIEVRATPSELGKKEEYRGTKRKQDQPRHDLRQGSRGLRRPKRPLSFQISGALKDHLHPHPHLHLASKDFSVSMSTTVDALEKRIHLINLIIRRNKNQHRGQLFFKQLCLLRRSLSRLLDVSSRLFEVSASGLVGSVRGSEEVRRNFEVEASLRSQKDVLEEHVREVLVPRCYVPFSGLVGDSQFGNLGVVLMALLSEIACGEDGVGSMRVVQDDDEVAIGREEEQNTLSDYHGSLRGTSTRVTGEDQGEIVERVYDRGVDEDEQGMDSEAKEGSHEILTRQEGSDHVPRGGTTQEDTSGIESRGQSTVIAMEDLTKVEQPFRKASRESKTGKEAVKRTKGKKSKNSIDDLFSGLL